MAEALKLADVVVGVKLDLSGYKRQVQQLRNGLPQITANNKAMIAGLRQEIALKRAAMRLDDARMRVIRGMTTTLGRGLIGVGGFLGVGFKNFLQTTDPMARKLQGSINRIKNSFFQLTANIAKQASIKWNLPELLDKLSKAMSNISMKSIDKFLDVAKWTTIVFAAGKLLTIFDGIKNTVEKISLAKLGESLAIAKAGGGAGGSILTGLAAGAGAAIGTRSKLSWNIGSFVASKFGQKMPDSIRAIGLRTSQEISPKSWSGKIPTTSIIKLITKDLFIFNIALYAIKKLFSEFGVDLSSLKNTLSFVLTFIKTFADKLWSVFKIVGAAFDMLMQPVYNLVDALFDLVKAFQAGMMGNWASAAESMKNVWNDLTNNSRLNKSWLDNLDTISKEWKNILDVSPDKTISKEWKNILDVSPDKTIRKDGKQQMFTKFGTSEAVGFADLNKAFQQMFETNLANGIVALADSTKQNTEATNNNTKALENVAQAVMATKGNMQIGTLNYQTTPAGAAIFNNSGLLNSITGANIVNKVSIPVQ